MARLTDPDILARYLQALTERNVEGAIVLIGLAPKGLQKTLENVREKLFREMIYRFVCEENGEIDQVKEEREPWRNEWEYHYDLRPIINGVKVYVETRLHPESLFSDLEPTIQIVQIKPA
jgi:hypothetical protein